MFHVYFQVTYLALAILLRHHRHPAGHVRFIGKKSIATGGQTIGYVTEHEIEYDRECWGVEGESLKILTIEMLAVR